MMKPSRVRFPLAFLLAGLSGSIRLGHVGPPPSIHDTVAGILDRLRKSRTPAELVNLSVPQVEAVLTPEEREILGTEHLSFKVSAPVPLSVIRDKRHGADP